MSAVLSALTVVVIALSPWASGQHRLAHWRAPEAQVLWIPAGVTHLPRYPVEDETPNGTRRLPFGGHSAVQIFHRFTLEAPPSSPWSLLLLEVDGQVELHVNGVPMKDSAVTSPRSLYRSSVQSRLWAIPRTYLHTGENRIDILIHGSGMRALTSGLYLGPQSSLEPAALWSEALTGQAARLVLLLSVIAMTVNLIAVALGAPAFHLAVAGAFSAVGARGLLAGATPAIGRFWPVADQLLVAGIILCAASALHRDPRPPVQARRWSETGLLTLTGLLGVAGLLAAGTGASGDVMTGVAAITTSVLLLVWKLPHAASGPVEGSLVQRILVGCGAGLGAVAIALLAAGAAGVPIAAPPLAAEFGVALSLAGAASLAISGGTVVAASKAYRHLRTRLDQSRIIEKQQAALDATARALDLKTRQSAVLEERQRMARDVHDGIGGQLASLIAQVRLRRVSMDQVEQALVGGLSELRLLVDSLDLVGETLADALASFLVRVRQQTAAAGVRLEWRQEADLAAEIGDPQWILNLYRLMQEAITNALRHSGGDRISVSIESNDGRSLVVRIEDNGASFDPLTANRGRGLANMAHRAAELGGSFAVERGASGGGAVVLVEVPLPG